MRLASRLIDVFLYAAAVAASTPSNLVFNGNRTGNWTQVKCSDRAVWDWDHMSQAERWAEVDAEHAFADAVRQWKTHDRDQKHTFSSSVLHTFGGTGADQCHLLKHGCDETQVCTAFVGEGTGPAAFLIYNSFVMVHHSFNAFHTALQAEVSTTVMFLMDSFLNKFAPPLPPKIDDEWLPFLIDIITLGATAGMGKVLRSCVSDMITNAIHQTALSQTPHNKQNATSIADLNNIVMDVISGTTTVAKSRYTNATIPGWTLEKPHDFEAWVGQAVEAISTLNDQALAFIFSGQNDAIDALAGMISDGKLISGVDANQKAVPPAPMTSNEIAESITTVIFGYVIPIVWRFSGRKPFILDSGYPCNAQDLTGVYLTKDTRVRTRGCYNNKLYFLVMPDGPPEHCVNSCHRDGCAPQVCRPRPFSPPPGVEYLDGKDKTFGDITVEKIIQGSVKTYIQNGNTNGGKKPDIANKASFADLINIDITTPGFFRIPVCTGEIAHKGWGNTLETDPNYPCLVP